MEQMINNIWRYTKRIIVFVIGSTVLIFGVILIFIPGPAIVVIPLGLAILATEFIWARMLLNKIKEKIMQRKKTKKSKFKN